MHMCLEYFEDTIALLSIKIYPLVGFEYLIYRFLIIYLRILLYNLFEFAFYEVILVS